MLGRIASVLGEKGVSIATLTQKPAKDGGAATILVITHRAREVDVQAAVKWIDALTTTRAPTCLVRIEEVATHP